MNISQPGRLNLKTMPQLNLTNPSINKLFHYTGILAIMLGVSYIVIIALYMVGGAPPSVLEARLNHMAMHPIEWWWILILSVVTDLFFIPISICIYLTLKDRGRNLLLTGAVLLTLFVVLDLAITWPNYSAMITLGQKYASATDHVQKQTILTAAYYPSEILDSKLLGIYIILIPSIGILLVGLVMLQGVFNKVTAYTALSSGVLGIISVVGPFFYAPLGLAIILGSTLTLIWSFLVGVKLMQLSRV